MKVAVFFVSSLLIISFLGCTDSNVSNPKNSQQSYSMLKLPAKASLKVEDIISVSKEIDGAIGGAITLEDSYLGVNGMVNVNLDVTIPADLFSGVQTVSVILDGQYAYFKFAPDLDASSINPVIFSCNFTGLDLRSGESYDFVYFDANNNIQKCSYLSVKSNISAGMLSVSKAQIIYFDPDSRYGWATIVTVDQ